MSRRRRRATRFVILGAAVSGLMLVALWRATAPRATPSTSVPPQAIGRPIALQAAEIREVPSRRTLWIRDMESVRFAVLDPDVKRTGAVVLEPGARVTLIGLVRATPRADVAMRQWGIDDATATRVVERGDYVYVTELRAQ